MNSEVLTYGNYRRELMSDIFYNGNVITMGDTVYPISAFYTALGGKSAVLFSESSMGKSTALSLLRLCLCVRNIPVCYIEGKHFSQSELSEIPIRVITKNTVILLDAPEEISKDLRDKLFAFLNSLINLQKGADAKTNNPDTERKVPQIIIASRGRKETVIGIHKLMESLESAELLPLPDKRVQKLVPRLSREKRMLLKNTMMLKLFLEILRSGERRKDIPITEAGLIDKYFSCLYKEKCSERSYVNDIADIGEIMYSYIANASARDVAVPQVLEEIFYYEGGVLHSSHKKYLSYALAVYLKSKITQMFGFFGDEIAPIRSRAEQLLKIKVSKGNNNEDLGEALYYLGQMLGDCAFPLIDAFKTDKKGFLPVGSTLSANIITVYLGYNGGVLDSGIPAIHSVDSSPSGFKLTEEEMKIFARHVRVLKYLPAQGLSSLSLLYTSVSEIEVDNESYRTENNSLIEIRKNLPVLFPMAE